MDWTLYLPEKRPNPLVEVLELMRIGHEHIIQAMGAIIICIISYVGSQFQDLNKQVQNLIVVTTESKSENRMQFGQHTDILRDHENRIRLVERKFK